jgi:uncharacterized protein (TIGR02284 family)
MRPLEARGLEQHVQQGEHMKHRNDINDIRSNDNDVRSEHILSNHNPTNDSPSIDILNDLIAATRDGKGFYEHAATKVKNPELKALFMRLAHVKAAIVRELSDEIRADGDVPTQTGTWSGDFNRFYTQIRAHLGDKTYAYVAQLEESEDQLLKAFDKALHDEDISPHAHAVINRQLPEVRSCHAIMRAQKIALKKAA